MAAREWLYGRNAVREALLSGRRGIFRLRVVKGSEEKGRFVEILKLASSYNLPVESVPRRQLDQLVEGHQGVVLEVGAYPYTTTADIIDDVKKHKSPPFILILDTLQDPQNFGSLLRTAEAVGIHGVLLPLRRTAVITPTVVKVSAGATEHLKIAQVNLAQAIERLKEENIWVIGLDNGPTAQGLDEVNLKGGIALVVGNEGDGIRHLVGKLCDVLLRLPMSGQIDSLNAAVAGSVGLYFIWQARRFS